MLSIWQRPPFGESMHFLLCHLCASKPLLLGDFFDNFHMSRSHRSYALLQVNYIKLLILQIS